MPIVDLKKKLHDVIDSIQDEQLLAELLLIISAKEFPEADRQFDDKQINELKEREARFDKGEMEAMPLASFKSHMRKKYGI